jgi:S-adenosylmethionine decarboxylase
MTPWGYHLLVDARQPNEAVRDENRVKKFFDELIVALNMKSLGPLIVGIANEPDNKGVSGVQMITTSHIAFHSDEIGNAFYLDVLSCKDFDEAVVLRLVNKTFAPAQVSVDRRMRGVKA